MTQNLTITNGSPRSIHPGIRDLSGREVPYTPEQVPQHCPLFMTQTPLGAETVILTTSDELMESHGAATFDQRAKWYSHQTHGMARCGREGNAFFHRRLVEDSATYSTAVFYLEIIKDLALPWQRDPLGGVVVTGGVKQTTGTVGVDEVEVYKVRWTVEELGAGENINNLPAQNGTLTSAIAGETAMKYPMFAVKFASRGEGGNKYGLELMFPHEASSSPGDTYAMSEYKTNLYRARVMYRESEKVSPSTIQTQLGMQFVDIPFGEEVLNLRTNAMYEDDQLIEAFEAQTPGVITRPAPFSEFVVYDDFITLVQELIAPEETALKGEDIEPRQINFLNEFDLQGKDQYAIRFTADSATMKSGNIHYLQGGTDGDVSEAALDTLVQDFIANKYDSEDAPLKDMARFPFTDLYDTGFTVDTKYTLLSAMGKRPDTFVTVCTQDLSLPDNDAATEYAMASGLSATARLIPESVLYGTPACRALITGQMGNVAKTDHIKRRRFPLVMDLITKRSRYMGAGDGRMKSAFSYSTGTNRHVEDFLVNTVTTVWKPENAYFADWDAGLNTVRHVDRATLFWPGLQTVYSNDTSVLNSDINVHICCDVIRRQHLCWAMHTGEDKQLTSVQLANIQRTMEGLIANRYDERITAEIDTYQTPADEARGYSYTMNATLYLNNQLTVATMNVTARRSSDLAA